MGYRGWLAFVDFFSPIVIKVVGDDCGDWVCGGWWLLVCIYIF